MINRRNGFWFDAFGIRVLIAISWSVESLRTLTPTCLMSIPIAEPGARVSRNKSFFFALSLSFSLSLFAPSQNVSPFGYSKRDVFVDKRKTDIPSGSSLARARSCRPVPAADKGAPRDHNRRLVPVRWIFPNLPFCSPGPPANSAWREQVNLSYLPEGKIPPHIGLPSNVLPPAVALSTLTKSVNHPFNNDQKLYDSIVKSDVCLQKLYTMFLCFYIRSYY